MSASVAAPAPADDRRPGFRGAVAEALLVALFATLPLATGPHEVVMAAALAAALLGRERGALLRVPWGRAALATAAVWALAAPASGDLREGLGHAWLLAPLAAVPALLAVGGSRHGRAPGARPAHPGGASAPPPAHPGGTHAPPPAHPGGAHAPSPLEGAPARALARAGAAWRALPLAERVTRAGLAAASVAAAWGVAQRLAGEVGTAAMSHHLSLAYALLPPLGVAVAGRRYGVAALLAGGVLATGSAGAGVALAVTVAGAALRRPVPALMAGLVTTVALLGAADIEELRQRAVLWTGGLAVAEGGAAGPGGYAAASGPAYEALVPGFWFPNHAHDSAIQLLAVLGPAGLVATLALCVALLRHGGTGAAAGLAGVLVGGLTQDVLGDLEVARAAWAWLALAGAGAGAGVAAGPTAPDPSPPHTSREPDAPGGY